MIKLEKTALAPLPLADEELVAVAGAKKGHKKYGLSFLNSPITNTQTNVSGPIVQLALGNEGDVTQAAFVSQSNSVSF
jgi:hypothetical protein